MFDQIWNLNSGIVLFLEISKTDLSLSLKDHLVLCDALKSGDTEQAVEAMRAHIREGLRLQRGAMKKRRSGSRYSSSTIVAAKNRLRMKFSRMLVIADERLMCGIAGRILPQYGPIGNDLVDLMDAQSHRGADSTGFAIYTTPVQRGGKLRLMGFNRKNLDSDLEDFRHILRSHGSDFLETPEVDASSTVHYSVRMLVESPRDVEHWIKEADLISERIEVQSFGKIT